MHGYRKLHDDLLDQGETCCPNRVARLARIAGITAQIGYRRRPGSYGGKPSVIVDNTLDRQFDVETPDSVWVTDITYIRTLEGFAYSPKPSRLHGHHKGLKNFYFNTYRCAWGEPAPTITQSGDQLGGRGGICHPDEDRTFTIRELKRLCSLPDDFRLTGTFNQRAERIGRMNPPKMVEAVAKSLHERVLARC